MKRVSVIALILKLAAALASLSGCGKIEAPARYRIDTVNDSWGILPDGHKLAIAGENTFLDYDLAKLEAEKSANAPNGRRQRILNTTTGSEVDLIVPNGFRKRVGEIAGLSPTLPEPPELSVKFIDEFKIVRDWLTNVDQVRVEFDGKPRLYQFHFDRSIGWIVRCKLSAYDNTTPICSTTNVVRDSCGLVIDHKTRRLDWHVNASGNWKFVSAEHRGGDWCDARPMWNGNDPNDVHLYIVPEDRDLNARYNVGRVGNLQFQEPRVTQTLELDLYFHDGLVKP